MDINEHYESDTAASTCKRQKRNNSVGDKVAIAETTVIAAATTAATATATATATVTAAVVDTAAATATVANVVAPPGESATKMDKAATTTASSVTTTENAGPVNAADKVDTAGKVDTWLAGLAQHIAEGGENVISHYDKNVNNNNNKNSSELEQVKEANDEPAKAMGILAAPKNVALVTAHSEIDAVAPLSPSATREGTGNEAVDDADNTTITSPRFNRPRALRTRSYRSVDMESTSESDNNSHSSNTSVRQFEANSADTNETDINLDNEDEDEDADDDDDNDDDDDDDDDSDDEAENESHSDSHELDESNSDSSMGFLNHDFSSSNEDGDSDNDNETVEPNPADKEQVERAVNKVMCKSTPSYNWNCTEQVMQREHNLFNRIGWRGGNTSTLSFDRGFYGSRQAVERMKLMHDMSRHRGCVNCLNFNRAGDLICSGSDDLSIIVWDWAKGTPKHSFYSGHNLNIFQTKFIDSAGCLDIVSSSRDGQVRRSVIPPSGTMSAKPTRLYTHTEAVHKIVVVPRSRHEIMSAGEDALVKLFDLRANKTTTILRCTKDKRRIRLFSVAHHPYAPEFCVTGSDDKLRVYDKRKLNKSIQVMVPKDLKDTKITQITCAVYNHSGSEILASYSDAGIYLFDSRNYSDGKFLHCYEGHINSRTIKGVNFFGPNSEYIISGSDCGNIFFWDKNTEAVINFMKGDAAGVVNCLEPHPWMPVLATSGLEYNVKLWSPTGLNKSDVPSSSGLKETLKRNFRRSLLDVGDFDISHIHYFIRQLIEPRRNANAAANRGGDAQERTRGLFSSSSSNSIISSPAHASSTSDELDEDASHPGSSDEGAGNALNCPTQ